jgi:hypothetical protein
MGRSARAAPRAGTQKHECCHAQYVPWMLDQAVEKAWLLPALNS